MSDTRVVTVRSDRDVDALIETEIFGNCVHAWKCTGTRDYLNVWMCLKCGKEILRGLLRGDPTYRLDHYSTDPAACAALKRKLREDGWWCVVKSPFDDGSPWVAGINPKSTTGWGGRPDFRSTADTEERALALAAMLAYGVTVKYEPEPAA